jgi:hypothetical protein
LKNCRCVGTNFLSGVFRAQVSSIFKFSGCSLLFPLLFW